MTSYRTIYNIADDTGSFTKVNSVLISPTERGGTWKMSVEATSALLYLFTRPPTWQPMMKDIRRTLQLSKEKTQRAIRLLIDEGYVARKRRKMPGDGQMAGWFWIISSVPMTEERIRDIFAEQERVWRKGIECRMAKTIADSSVETGEPDGREEEETGNDEEQSALQAEPTRLPGTRPIIIDTNLSEYPPPPSPDGLEGESRRSAPLFSIAEEEPPSPLPETAEPCPGAFTPRKGRPTPKRKKINRLGYSRAPHTRMSKAQAVFEIEEYQKQIELLFPGIVPDAYERAMWFRKWKRGIIRPGDHRLFSRCQPGKGRRSAMYNRVRFVDPGTFREFVRGYEDFKQECRKAVSMCWRKELGATTLVSICLAETARDFALRPFTGDWSRFNGFATVEVFAALPFVRKAGRVYAMQLMERYGERVRWFASTHPLSVVSASEATGVDMWAALELDPVEVARSYKEMDESAFFHENLMEEDTLLVHHEEEI